MFKKKEQVIRYHYHPGIYEFNFPLLKNDRVPYEEGKVIVHYVPIRMKIGYEYTKNDKLVSVQYFEDNEGLSIQNFIEKISSEVANTIIKNIFHGQIPVDEIEWFEEHHIRGKKKLLKVEMEWDDEKSIILVLIFDLLV